MKLIYPYFKKNAVKIIAGLLCMILVDAAQLVIPKVIQQAVDILSQASLDQAVLIRQCGLIVFMGVFMAILRYGWRNLLMGCARDVEKGIRDDLFEHILRLDMPFHDSVKTGDIMAHATSDINHVRMAFGFGLIVLVDTVLLGGATLAIMVVTHPKLTAFAMIPMPLLVILTRHLGKKMHQFHTSAQESFSILTEMIRENFFGIRIIKVFNFEPLATEKISQAARHYFNRNLKRAVVTALLRPMLGLFFNISTLIILCYGGWLVIQNSLSAGELVAFLQYLGILAWPVIAIGWMTNLFQRGMASLERLNSLLDARPEIAVSQPISLPGQISGPIVFDRVHFSYTRGASVLNDISLQIMPNTTIGISGPPGSGKTSLVQLLPRLYDFQSGNLKINHHDIKRLDPSALRADIAFMPQEAFLFSGTIKENILMGRDLDPELLDRIIHTCCLTQTIAKMPDGLETLVGERGITLSGGQKQRMSLARTLVDQRPVTILDDPVSQIDTQTAAVIMERIHAEKKDGILIIISHRISALAACDTIYILNAGTLEGSGPHQELIRTNRFYADSFRVQQFEEKGYAGSGV